ncbi:peptide/nickel transport system permease protein [Kribbella rubisoli]|uniref:Peptide/nickel transport system permease protein n=1 Tax=Kribbella rubisoli TaxID=3075929 RepID=A0A4Q7X8T4_9ACTN|nr:ABC transporter permease subunit [Kribbella rubisoli]RZU19065.1 peptide/nickel transport system permease protein [Kribbella rubisoli]
MNRRGWIAAGLIAVPLGIAILGPLVSYEVGKGLPYSSEGLLGTDGLGRDVFGLLLVGGRTALGMAVGAVVLAYVVGGAIGLVAASTRHRWLDEGLMRPLDVLLPLPSLLVISVVAVGWRASALAIMMAVAMVNVPTVARLVRAAALDAASGPVVEALRMQRESWFAIQIGYVGRSVLGPVAADLGTRITLAVFLVASVNFLGLGLSPTAPDWAVSVSRNREGLLLQPWSVLAPALLLVSFTLGFNLLADRLVHRSRQMAAV